MDKIFDEKKFSFKTIIKQIRIHHWLKNSLIFIPLLVSKNYVNPHLLFLSIVGFFSFNCLASSTYIVNDLLDLDSDRQHERKKHRPLANSSITILNGILMAFALFLISFAIALTLGKFIYVLIIYLLITLFYSFKIKQYVGLDIIALASLYTIRIIAGAAIINVIVSFWLLCFSMFIFFSLALIKRCAEIKSLEADHLVEVKGRDYNAQDYLILVSMGVSSGLLAILMFCFYIQSDVILNQYQEPALLWLIVPALAYWLIRMWIKTHRGEMHDDPIVFSTTDKGSLLTIVFMVVITILGHYL